MRREGCWPRADIKNGPLNCSKDLLSTAYWLFPSNLRAIDSIASIKHWSVAPLIRFPGVNGSLMKIYEQWRVFWKVPFAKNAGIVKHSANYFSLLEARNKGLIVWSSRIGKLLRSTSYLRRLGAELKKPPRVPTIHRAGLRAVTSESALKRTHNC